MNCNRNELYFIKMNVEKKNIPKTFVDVYYAVYIFIYLQPTRFLLFI